MQIVMKIDNAVIKVE